MKTFKRRRTGATATLAAVSLLLLFLPVTIRAQQNGGAPPAQTEAGQGVAPTQVKDADLPRLLNLTPDQVGKIRTILEQDKDEWRAARQHLNQAQRALDQAIYQDNADEGVIEARSRDVTTAQAAVGRLRAMRELNIRRVLTPEQLSTLRDLRFRARFAQREQKRAERQQERRMNNEAPRQGTENPRQRPHAGSQGEGNKPAQTQRLPNERLSRPVLPLRERRERIRQRNRL